MSLNCQYEHQGRCKVNITSNQTISASEQTFLDEASIQLFQKEAELVQAWDDFTRANDTLTAITSDLYHLQKSREKSCNNKDIADRQVRSFRFLLELSQAIVSAVDENKPFAIASSTPEENKNIVLIAYEPVKIHSVVVSVRI